MRHGGPCNTDKFGKSVGEERREMGGCWYAVEGEGGNGICGSDMGEV